MPRNHDADLANVPLHLYLHRIAPLATTVEGRRALAPDCPRPVP
jgi:hypothetical protein